MKTLILLALIGFILPQTVQAAGPKSLIRVISNEKNLEACMVEKLRARLKGIKVTSDLFETSANPFAEVFAICEPRTPTVKDRSGRPLATQSLLACATSINTYPGSKAKAGANLSRRISVFPAVGGPTSLCAEIGLRAGKRLYQWILN